MADKIYTVLVVPERSSKVRRLKIPHRYVVRTILGACALMALAGVMTVNYFHVIDRASQSPVLKEENIDLKWRLRLVQEQIARIDGTLQRIDQFSEKIKGITQLNDPARSLAIGPLSDDPDAPMPQVQYALGERIGYEDELIDSKLALRLIDSKLDTLEGEALQQESNLRELREFFMDDSMLLATTPSVRPTKSKLLTSTFGQRTDPYTNHRVMHKGVDFAADHGSDVMAPSDGIVVFVGNRGGYGKSVVIDHGYGFQTHYGHLSSYKVEIGQRVLRGQVFAAVGNTGRSTGPHLHYEVRLSGIPYDPEKFILN